MDGIGMEGSESPPPPYESEASGDFTSTNGSSNLASTIIAKDATKISFADMSSKS